MCWLRRWRRTGSWRSWRSELRAENARLREQVAAAAGAGMRSGTAELEKLRADLAVLQRMVFGRSSEKSRPEPPGGDGGDAGGGAGSAGTARGG